MTGLYVHLPFCVKKCHYCDFTIALAGPPERHDRFLEALASEAAHWRAPLAGRVFDTLYLGGGTPSTLREAEMEKLFRALKAALCIAEDAETTIEVNPGEFDASKAALYRRLDIGRASLGAQSFNDAALSAAGRMHGAEASRDAFRLLRGAGFSNISLDLMLALPGETARDTLRSVEEAVALGPEHISLYELVVEKRTRFGKMLRDGSLKLPAEQETLRMLAQAQAALRRGGYRQYELLSWSKPGFESRHNLIYWRNLEYLGLGPGAFSYLEGRRFRLAADVQSYLEKCERGDYTPSDEERLDPDRREVESLLLALRLDEGAPRGRFAGVLERLQGTLDSLRAEGLVEMDERRLRLSEKGKLFAETVFSELSLC